MGARLALTFLVLAAALGAISCSGRVATPLEVRSNLDVRRFRLANGLDVVLHPDPTFHDVVVDVRYDAGSKDDPPARAGLAHLVEHLTFRSEGPDGRDAFNRLEEIGSTSHNGETTTDWTEYHEVVPASALPLALWIEARRMAFPLQGVTPDVFDVERRVVLNEWREHYTNVPFGNVRNVTLAALFPVAHPYHAPTIGREEDLQRAHLVDAKDFVAAHYVAANATLVIAGRFDPRRATALVHEIFDPVPLRRAPPVRAFAVPRLDASRRVVVEAAVDAPAVEIGWIVPPPASRGSQEIALVERELGGWVKYRLREDVRRANADVVPGRLGSALLVRIELAPGASIDSALSRLDDELAMMMESSDSLGDAKSSVIASRVIELGDLAARAARIQDFVSFYDEPNSLQSDLHAFSAVTPASIQEAVSSFLVRGRRVVVEVRPTPDAPKAGRVR